MSSKDIDKYCNLQPEGLSLLKTAMEKLNLSARAFDKIKNMKFKSKLVYKIAFAILLPIIVISIILSVVLYQNISVQKEEEFTNQLEKVVFNYIEYLDFTLESVSSNAKKDAIFIENANELIAAELLQITTTNLFTNEIIYGSGIFFNKNIYKDNQEVAFFYSYNKGDDIVQIEVNDNKDEDYFNYFEINPEWWAEPSSNHNGGWTKPYLDTLAGQTTMVTYYQPFFFDDHFAGIVTIDISYTKLENWLDYNKKQQKNNQDASIFLISQDSTTIFNDKRNRIGLNVFDTLDDNYNKNHNTSEAHKIITSAIAGKTGNNIVKSFDGSKSSIAFFAPLHHTKWAAISVIPYSVIQDAVYKALSKTLLIIIAFIILLIIVIILVARYISNPMIKLSNTSLKIAEGDYTTTININSNDEIGVLANNFNLMTEKVNEREKKLVSANKKLLVLDEAKNQFLMLISHEIRTPLNGIVGSTYFLKDMIDDPELKDFLDMLKESVDRLDKFSRTALEITQMQTVGREIDKTSIHLEDTITKVIESKLADAKEKHCTLNATYSGADSIFGIKDYFTRTIEELISNAIKYSNENTEIEIGTFEEDGKIKFRVSDTGEVIPPEKIEVITKPFGLAKDHYDKDIGLGLNYVQTFLDIHNASMEIKSSVERTEITLIFDIP